MGSSSLQKPVKLRNDVKQRKQKAKRPLNKKQTTAQANETKRKYHRCLHRGKLAHTVILSSEFIGRIRKGSFTSLGVKDRLKTLETTTHFDLIKNLARIESDCTLQVLVHLAWIPHRSIFHYAYSFLREQYLSQIKGSWKTLIFTSARIPVFFSGRIYHITPKSTVWKAGCGFACLKGRAGLMNS